MATYDPGDNPITAPPGASPAYDPGDNPITPPSTGADRSALGEIGTGFARGALVDLPTLAGQAAKFIAPTGSGVANFGQGLVQNAAARGQQSWLTLNPQAHGSIVNALATGAEQVPSIAAPIAGVVGAAAALPFELPAAAVGLGGAAAGGALFGAQAGQQTLEKAQAAGVSPEAAQTASRLNAATTFATQVGLGMVGGQVLGVAGTALGRMVGAEAQPLAADVLSRLAGNGSVLGATAKAAAVGGAEAVGIGAAQSAASAGIEQHYGIDNTSPLQAAEDSIMPMLGLTAIMTPLGLAGRALGARAASNRTAMLAHPDTNPAMRSALADQYATAIEQQSGNADAARAFSQNAQIAIDHNQPLDVSPEIFNPRTPANAPNPENPGPRVPLGTPQGENGNLFGQPPAAPVDLLGNPLQPATEPAATPEMTSQPGQRDLFDPNGNLLRNPYDVQQEREAAVSAVRGATSGPTASTQDFINQLTGATSKGMTDKERTQRQADITAALNEPSGVRVSDATTGLERQLTVGELAQQRAAAYENAATPRDAAKDALADAATKPVPGVSAQDMINSVTGVDRDGLSKQEQAKRRADAKAALDAPSGVRVSDATNGIERELSMGELYDLRNQPTPEAPAARQPNAPKQAADIAADIATANKTVTGEDKVLAQQSVPVQKQLDAIGISELDTHDAQIDALQARLTDPDVKIGTPTRDRLTAMLNQWKTEQAARAPEEPAVAAPEAAPALGTAPAQAETLPQNIGASVETPAPATELPQNIPAAAPDNAPAPAQAESLGENVTQSAQSHAQDTADMVDATLAQFNRRVRGGEQLTPLEQERMEDLQGMRNSLAEVTSGGNVSDDYAQSISDMAREAATTPYKESYRRYVADNPEATDPGIMLDSLRTGKLQDTLATIAGQGSTPEVKALADKIAPLVPDTTLKYAAPDGTGAAGEFLPATNHVNIFPGGESEQTILHEAVHAATQARIAQAETIAQPRTQAEAQLRKAYTDIEQVRQDVISRIGESAYGLTNAHEFVAELHSNPEFQQVLKDAQTAPGKPSLWTRAVNAVKNLLGLKPGEADYLNKAMAASESFFGQPGPDKAGFPLPAGSSEDRLFRKSPQDAADVTDKNYTKMTGLINGIKDVDLNKLNLQVFRKTLGWKTMQFIADRIRALPEMVQSGFAAGLDAVQKAHENRRIVSNLIEHPVASYADGLRKTLAGLKDQDKARDLSRQMMTIGGEASRGGFDYRMNYADNVKAGRDLPSANKAYVDDIHRQFTQLQRTNPEIAKAIEQGELMAARTNTLKTATVLRNLINVQQDATMLPHAAKLDIMDPTLKSARNPDAARFADGTAAALNSRLQAAFADAAKLPQGSMLKDQINELRDLYNAQAQNPYFSLGRQGDYFVKVAFQNMDAATQAKLQDALRGTNKVLGNLLGGETHTFFRVETQDQAQGMYNKLLQAGGDKILSSTSPNGSAWGKLADRTDSAFGVSPALRSILASLHESVERSGLSGEAAATMRDTITRELLSMLPETSSRNALMQRRGIPGYDADFLGNFARRAMGGVQDTSNMHSQPAFTAARQQMETAIGQLNRTGSAEGRVRAQMVADEVNTRLANSQKPVDNSTINLINSLGHTFYLAASPAYLIRTAAQPLHRGLPLTGARFGFVNAAKELGKATPTAFRIMANTIADGYSANGLRGVLDASMSFRNLGLPQNEVAFIQELHDRGVLNLGQARQLQSMAMGGTQLQQDIARMASMTAQYAEMTNRLAIGLSAFRLAEKSNPGGDVAKSHANTEYAIQTIDRAMDNFDPSNTARNISKNAPITGKVTPLLTAFMNYNLQTMQQIARTVHDGLFNRDPSPAGLQRAKEARREFAGLMGTTAMISGALGLPFANVFAGVYNTLTNDNNEPSDIRISTQNFLDRMFGHTVGGVLAHGIPHAVGFDSSTFGLENLLPGSEFLSSRQLLKDRLADQSQAMMGPALNAGVGIVDAMDKISDGYYVKGIESALPSGLKPYFKAAELATKGYTNSKENPQAINPVTPDNPYGNKATWGQIALQAAGFRTARAAEVSEAQQFASARQDRLDYQRGLIEDQFYKGALSGDQSTIDRASTALQQFNMANPMQPIRGVADSIRSRMISLALAGITGTGVAAQNPRQALSLGQQLMFATDNNDPYGAMP